MTPQDTTHWSVRTMAKAEALSPTMTHRIWQAHGLQPHRVETFKLSRDPEFVKKLVKKLGRRRWKPASGYHRQGRVKNAFFRYTSIIGEGLRAWSPERQDCLPEGCSSARHERCRCAATH